MLKFRAKALLVALFTVGILAFFQAGGAEAASNGNHDQGFTCTSTNSNGDSTTISSVFSYHTTGIGSSSTNQIFPDRFAYHTTPAALLNSIDIALGDTSGDNHTDMLRLADSQHDSQADDVASSDSFTSFRVTSLSFSDNTPGNLGMWVTGGVGNAGGSCSIKHDSL